MTFAKPATPARPSNLSAAMGAVTAVLLAAHPTMPAAAEPLRLTLNPPAKVRVSDKPPECETPLPPVIALSLVSRYGNDDSRRDDIDEEADAAFQAGMKPVREYQRAVVKLANKFSEKFRLHDAQCALTWLHAWAEADALREMGNHTAEYKRGTTLASLALSHAQIRSAVADDPRTAVVDAWLVRTAMRVRDHYDALTARRSRANNHRYWAGLAVGAAATVGQDRTLFAWAVDTLRMGACAATAEGALPLELERGKKAREYHFHALNALVPLAEIAAVNGVDAYGLCDNGIKRIVEYAIRSISDPSAVEAAADAKQERFADGRKLPPTSRLPFAQIYLQRFPEAIALRPDILDEVPYRLTDIGGRVNFVYFPPDQLD
ncbi:MAG: alginate lyase family protein [Rhizobiaceae bacterium]|nr:alginate lyase family protein [Rhizobiaceae bacterium]